MTGVFNTGTGNYLFPSPPTSLVTSTPPGLAVSIRLRLDGLKGDYVFLAVYHGS